MHSYNVPARAPDSRPRTGGKRPRRLGNRSGRLVRGVTGRFQSGTTKRRRPWARGWRVTVPIPHPARPHDLGRARRHGSGGAGRTTAGGTTMPGALPTLACRECKVGVAVGTPITLVVGLLFLFLGVSSDEASAIIPSARLWIGVLLAVDGLMLTAAWESTTV